MLSGFQNASVDAYITKDKFKGGLQRQESITNCFLLVSPQSYKSNTKAVATKTKQTIIKTPHEIPLRTHGRIRALAWAPRDPPRYHRNLFRGAAFMH